MFQGVMDEEMRHDLGAHYTSEENILKVIRPLFLDRLREEFDVIAGKSHAEGAENAELRTPVKNSLWPPRTPREKKIRLRAFHDKLASLSFLDPACGCGNFLLIAYRELRRLEADVLAEVYKDDPSGFLDISSLCKVNVSQFFGLEIGPFAAEIAKVALWLMDHLCNLDVADRFGRYKKANDLIQGTITRCAFVSTNSISQGEQVALLWKNLNAEIDFAYRTDQAEGLSTR